MLNYRLIRTKPMPSPTPTPTPTSIVRARAQSKRWCLLFGAIAIQTLLGACSQQALRTDSRPTATWSDHQARMLALSNWHIKGKIGYKSDLQGGSAWLDWRQNLKQFNLVLSGPFGAGTVQIFGNDNYVTLRQTNAADISAASAAALSRKLLGWGLPVNELAYWIRGIPAPDVAISHQTFNEQGLLNSLHQRNWQLAFSKYRQTQAGSLPTRLVATSLSAPSLSSSQQTTHFKLIIKEQAFTAPASLSGNSTDSNAQSNTIQTKQPPRLQEQLQVL